MPFYEYQCGDCDHRLEVLQKISDEPLIFCPQCNAATLKKLISVAAFRLKGSGWYETDFKHNDKQKEKSADKKPADDAKSASPSSADKPSTSNGDSSQPAKGTPTKDMPARNTAAPGTASPATT